MRRRQSRGGRLRCGVALLAVVLALPSSACGRDDFEDRTARVELGERTTTYDLDSCGLDGTTVFVVGRSPGGGVLQAVVGVEDDGATGVVASTGLTVSNAGAGGDADLAAFGEEAWRRREQVGRAPGQITSARVRGSRIQVAGRLEEVDGEGRPPAVADPDRSTSFSLDARCDQVDG